MKRYNPSGVIALGRTGRAFIFDSRAPGKTTIFRAELDALPVTEQGELSYKSVRPGISHACGHDGHMAILAGLGARIASNPPDHGRAVLLFQPAEEVEQGARDVLSDKRFKEIEPDAIFALHNIPGIPTHQLVTRVGSFAAASKGMVITLEGISSHAGEPEKGINPAFALARIILEADGLSREPDLFSNVAFATVIHLHLGKVAHGTSPGHAEVRLTLRAYENRDMETLTTRLESLVEEISVHEGLKYAIHFTELFPATVNDRQCVSMIEKAAREQQIPISMLDAPFRWSEDFGYYTEKYPGGYVGLGSGVLQPALHQPAFDFPDEILETGIRFFYSLYAMNHHHNNNQ
jgi:amidohydrolase